MTADIGLITSWLFQGSAGSQRLSEKEAVGGVDRFLRKVLLARSAKPALSSQEWRQMGEAGASRRREERSRPWQTSCKRSLMSE